MRSRLLFPLSILLLPPLYAGDFSKSFGRTDTVKVSIPVLPPVFTGARYIAVVLDQVTTGFAGERMRAEVENRLASDFAVRPSAPELVFRLKVTAEPVKVEIIARTESVRMQTGTRPATDANGNPVLNAAGQQMMQPVYENRDVPVEVWQASGQVTVQVEVATGDGRSIDGFSPSQTFDRRVVISSDGVAQTDRNQLPNEQQISNAMITAVANEFLARYCRQKEVLDLRLAVDEELRPGNEMAKVGQWQKAFELWSEADPRKFPGDKAHNLAVVHEARFYEDYWNGAPVEELEKSWSAAKQLFDTATQQDPRERQIQAAQDRMKRAGALVQRLKTLTPLVAGSGVGTSSATTGPTQTTVDSQAVVEFKRLIRLRIRNLTAQMDTERPALEATGTQAFQLSPEDSKKHVEEEVASWLVVREKLLTYKSTFDSFNTDQKISGEERRVLRGLAGRLSLGMDDLKLVEVVGTFTEVP